MNEDEQIADDAAPVSEQTRTAHERGEYAQVSDRLSEIAAAVEDPDMPLDDALALFEEAVKLGMRASDMLEDDIAAESPDDDTDAASADDTTASTDNPAEDGE